MRFLVLRHVAYEGLGTLADYMASRGHTWAYLNLYEGIEIPPHILLQNDGLIAMGGPPSVNDAQSPSSPHRLMMQRSLRIVSLFLNAGRPVLGICLGAQVIARAAGGTVTTGTPEAGFGEVTLYEPVQGITEQQDPALPVFHWHGETFSLPDGARRLAGNHANENQAFTMDDGRILALQFHTELDSAVYAVWHTILSRQSAWTLQPVPEPGDASSPWLDRLRDSRDRILAFWKTE